MTESRQARHKARGRAGQASVTSNHDEMLALLKADLRAAEIRREATGGIGASPTIFCGAPTHCAAHLLKALDEHGWRLVPKEPSS